MYSPISLADIYPWIGFSSIGGITKVSGWGEDVQKKFIPGTKSKPESDISKGTSSNAHSVRLISTSNSGIAWTLTLRDSTISQSLVLV